MNARPIETYAPEGGDRVVLGIYEDECFREVELSGEDVAYMLEQIARRKADSWPAHDTDGYLIDLSEDDLIEAGAALVRANPEVPEHD